MGAIPQPYVRQCAPVVPLSDGRAMIARIECAQCGGHDEWRITSRRPPPDILPKHFANKGWRIGRKPLCHACQQSVAKEKHMPEAVQNVTPIKPESAPSMEVRAMKLKATELLMAYYSMEHGRYDDGWSDERVAKESGMPPAWVTKRREEDFGPLREPTEFEAIRKEASELASAIGKLQAKLDAMSKRNGWKA